MEPSMEVIFKYSVGDEVVFYDENMMPTYGKVIWIRANPNQYTIESLAGAIYRRIPECMISHKISDDISDKTMYVRYKAQKYKAQTNQWIPKRIIYNNPATIVFWQDGTKTVVKKAKGDKYNEYNAFCAALAKKIFETNSALMKIVKSGVDQKAKKEKKK